MRILGRYPRVFGSRHGRYIASRLEVEGYEWEIRFYPGQIRGNGCCDLALELVFLSEPRADNHVTASLSGRLVDLRGVIQPSTERISPSKSFKRPSDSSGSLAVMTRMEAHESGYFKNGSVTVECAVTVLRDPEDTQLPLIRSSNDLQSDLGELLRSEAGADVTFLVSGASFAAHKNVLAARSPVFMAEFFGEMEESTSACVEIEEMGAELFKAMLRFVYTDAVPELDQKQESVTAMAQHLLVAADRYGLERLRAICERRIAINTDTVATTFALAEQHGCSLLKARCVEFITGGSVKNLDAIMATEGFKRLQSSSPFSVLTELLQAAHKRIKR